MDKNKQFVITINREVGSGGRTVGRKLAERLGVKYYDKALVKGLTQKFGLTLEEIERIKGQKKSWWNEFNIYYNARVGSARMPMEAEVQLTTASMFETEKAILQELAKEESCVVAGRSGFLVFRDWPNHLNVFIQASQQHRVERIMRKQGVSEQQALDIIEKMDSTRETYIQKYDDTTRYDTRNYQIVLSMDDMTPDAAADVIMAYINAMGSEK
ncbi:MAG: cytidylate kinase-like family protein [Prevotella sp.]|jgi:cytidylate kinase|nr:cytidylate kinase-like family protein [Prevotella sp.]MBR3066789.1 cytidylate kinase-like family protein [Prevotella sp.]MCR5198179.1 cytidylate kinase-like family protein [Prevotella sp.]